MEYIWCPVCRSEPERGPQWQCLPVCGMSSNRHDERTEYETTSSRQHKLPIAAFIESFAKSSRS